MMAWSCKGGKGEGRNEYAYSHGCHGNKLQVTNVSMIMLTLMIRITKICSLNVHRY